MSSAAEPFPWSVRRWILAFLLVLTAQFGLVFWFSKNPRATPALAKPRTHLTFLMGRNAPGQRRHLTDQGDPTLFALVTAEGFSGPAWLKAPQLDYQPVHPPEPLRWLTLPLEELADDFAEFVQTNLLSEDLVADRLPPALAQPSVPTPVVVASTALKVEGPLRARRRLADRRLPQASEPILTNTVVRVLVDQSGAPVSAALLSSSGATKPDQDALDFARTARFAPANRSAESGLTSGDLVFQWARISWDPKNSTAAKR
jgi:TonB family protein